MKQVGMVLGACITFYFIIWAVGMLTAKDFYVVQSVSVSEVNSVNEASIIITTAVIAETLTGKNTKYYYKSVRTIDSTLAYVGFIKRSEHTKAEKILLELKKLREAASISKRRVND